jgi:hypothetical protein
VGLFSYPQTYKSGGNRIAFEGLIYINKNNMIQEKKYSITLYWEIYTSDNLEELEQLAKDFSISEEFDEMNEIVDFKKSVYNDENENLYSIVYDNGIEIETYINMLAPEELDYFKSKKATR